MYAVWDIIYGGVSAMAACNFGEMHPARLSTYCTIVTLLPNHRSDVILSTCVATFKQIFLVIIYGILRACLKGKPPLDS